MDLYVATGRDKHGVAVETGSDPPPPGASPKEAMREKLRTEAGRAAYKMRKAIVEPVFGQIEEQRGFRRFSLPGKENVRREWRLVCAVSNLLKLFRAGGVPEMTEKGRKKGPISSKPHRKIVSCHNFSRAVNGYFGFRH